MTNLPSGLTNVVAVATGGNAGMALHPNGSIAVWGTSNLPAVSAPTNIVAVKAIASGLEHNLAIASDGLQPLGVNPDVGMAILSSNFTFNLLGVTATNVHYQWQFAGTNITGATGASFTLTNVTAADAGTYTVMISNSGGSVSRTATLIIVQAPQIVATSPTPSTLWFNIYLTLQVAATNAGQELYPPNYQWSFNGTAIGDPTYGTNAMITLYPSPTNEGVYSVVITNAGGSTNVSWTIRYSQPGMVEAWGSDSYHESDRPTSLTNTVALATGEYQSVAVTDTGAVVQWGDYYNGSFYSVSNTSYVTLPPTNGVVAVSAGVGQALALLTNGMVTNWGLNGAYGNSVPAGLSNVYAISCGWYHDVALLTNGTVKAWGMGQVYSNYTMTNVPAGLSNVTAISAGGMHSLAVSNGYVVAWGEDTYGETNVPGGLSGVVAVAAGAYHSLALRTNGAVVAWGDNSYGQCTVPAAASNSVMAIAAGDHHSLALRNDGTLVAWGENLLGQSTVPSNAPIVYNAAYNSLPSLGFVTNPPCAIRLIAAAGDHSLTSLYSPLLQYSVNPSNDLLLIYNTNSADSSNVYRYYTNNRPMVSSANALGIGCTNGEIISVPDFTNSFVPQITGWLTNHPTKRPQYMILFPVIPSRVSLSSPTPSIQWELFSGWIANWAPFVTSINMTGAGGTNDCRGYIDKLKSFASNSPTKLFVSASAAGYSNTNWYFDDNNGSGLPFQGGFGADGKQGVLAANPSASVYYTYTNTLTNCPSLSGYYSPGAHNGVWTTYPQYPTNGDLTFPGSSGWFLIATDESFNGQRVPDASQGNFLAWFASNAFGGTNYSCTPAGAVCHVDEPGNLAVNPAVYYGYWALGKTLASSAWNSLWLVPNDTSHPHIQVVGDPFVTR